MDDKKFLAQRFEQQRGQLRAVAYRMLGSVAEAEDAVQETWFKAERADISQVRNLAGWLTTVAGRVCLDMLRIRKARREEPLPEPGGEPTVVVRRRTDPEAEAELADAVGSALLIVLDRLSPVERLAFVLHDMFAVPFDDIAPIVERSPATTQKLASRARNRVRGTTAAGGDDRRRKHRLVEAFLHAARNGEFEQLVSILDPDAVLRCDAAAQRLGGTPALTGGARRVAEVFSGNAQAAVSILLDGEIGVLVAPRGTVLLAMRVTFDGDRITALEATADRDRLDGFELAVPQS